MGDLIIFSLKESLYAIDLEYIKRIIQVPKLTDVPNDHPFIEGMMSYEESVIKVVSFRKMLEYESYDEELRKLFENLKGQHKAWVEALENTIEMVSPSQKPPIHTHVNWASGLMLLTPTMRR